MSEQDKIRAIKDKVKYWDSQPYPPPHYVDLKILVTGLEEAEREIERLKAQIELLVPLTINHVGETGKNESACEVAVRLLKQPHKDQRITELESRLCVIREAGLILLEAYDGCEATYDEVYRCLYKPYRKWEALRHALTQTEGKEK